MDRRQRKTRSAIYQAFESLVMEEPYAQVTVAEIIGRADIGRSTFYAHFETKDDLLRDMCTQIFDHIFEGVNAHCETHRELYDGNLEGRLAHLLYHLHDAYGSICGKLLEEGEPTFTRYFTGRLEGLIRKGSPKLPQDVPETLAMDLYVSTFREAIIWWVKAGEEASPEDLAHWYMEMLSATSLPQAQDR